MEATVYQESYNSNLNQDIKSKFVGINVNISVSTLIKSTTDYQEGSMWDRVENLYSTDHYDCDLEENCDCDEDEKAQFPEYCECECSCESEPVEIYEWWSVSEFLAEKLKEKGQPILEDFGYTIWGRTCTGQSIMLDEVISEICIGMEILEGQKTEWKL